MSTTTERLIRLVERGEVVNQACAGRVLGVTRERVRQIVAQEGLRLGRKNQPNTLIEWPCPDCGKTMRMWTKDRNVQRTGMCVRCASGRKKQDYCKRGHLMAETQMWRGDGNRYCGACNRLHAHEQYWGK